MRNGAVSIFPERNRAIYNKIKAKLAEQQFAGVVQPATLRTEVYTVNGGGDYALALKDNAPKLSSNAKREARLKEQDAFVVTRVRMSVLLETVAGPVGHERIHTFPSALPFADESGGFQNSHLGILWNGNLTLKVGDTIYLDSFPVANCYSARTQQETASLKSERLNGDGFIEVTPQFALKGFDDNDLRFKIPSIASTHKIQYTATSAVVLVFEFEGFKITGAGTGKLDLRFAGE